jgi:hypothetical protein
MKSYRLKVLYLFIILTASTSTMAQWDEDQINYQDEIRLDEKQAIVTQEYSAPIAKGNSDLKSRYSGNSFKYNDYQPPVRKPRTAKRVDITGGLGYVFKLLLVLAGLFLLYILYRVLSDFNYAKKNGLNSVDANPIRQSTEGLEEEVDTESLTFLIQDAKISGNFTLAIRYYFLLYLEKLQENNVLIYHREKTNSDYLSEIKDTERSTQFLKVSYLFEYAWYGKKTVSETDFAGIEAVFKEQIGAVR